MPAVVDTAPFGSHAPAGIDRVVLAATRRMPANAAGLRLAMLLRRLTMIRLGQGPLDTEAFGLKLRLYPRGNGCEKGALFTPQMYEREERDGILAAIERVRGENRPFLFVDIGANVGLFSLIAMRLADGRGRALAIEPQPGVRERLAFNVASNPGLDIRPVGVAIADRDEEVELVIDGRDLGGTRIGGRGGPGESVLVRARKLLDVLVEEGFTGADLLKIDVEGAEELVLEPFLRDADDAALPRSILLPDHHFNWTRDVFAMLRARGYREGARSRQNVFFHRGG